MSKITAKTNGENYQACHFWINAFKLLVSGMGVERVIYEDNEFTGFDDIVVYYNPPKEHYKPIPINRDCYQIKWHTTQDYKFGYRDLVKPKFINNKCNSLLKNLHEAKKHDELKSRFIFITTARIRDDDPLNKLVSSTNNEILIEKLKKGKTASSEMGSVRKYWREAMDLKYDDELFEILENFVVFDHALNLEKMQEEVYFKANMAGIILPDYEDNISDFKFEHFARKLLESQRNNLNKELLTSFLKGKGLKLANPKQSSKLPTEIAVISFERLSTNISDFEPENVLKLTSSFNGRYLHDKLDWNHDIANKVSNFLHSKVINNKLRLTLDAHASIAFIAGQTLYPKSGVEVELVQNSRNGKQLWHSDDGCGAGYPKFEMGIEKLEKGSELVIAINASRSVTNDVIKYIEVSKLKAGMLLECKLPSGPGQTGISCGQHAAMLSDQIAEYINALKIENFVSLIHIFIAAPNSLVFYLGQHSQALGSIQMYEFDFDKERTGTYIKSVRFGEKN